MARKPSSSMPWPWVAPAARLMFSSISVPPRSLPPASRSWRAPAAPSFTHDAWTLGMSVAVGDAGDGVHEQRLAEGRAPAGLALQVDRRRHVHERQADELGEAAGLLLQVAGDDEVPGPRPGLLDRAEHDRDVAAQPDRVGGAVGLEPLLGVDLVGAQDGPDLVVEDLGRGAGQACAGRRPCSRRR